MGPSRRCNTNDFPWNDAQLYRMPSLYHLCHHQFLYHFKKIGIEPSSSKPGDICSYHNTTITLLRATFVEFGHITGFDSDQEPCRSHDAHYHYTTLLSNCQKVTYVIADEIRVHVVDTYREKDQVVIKKKSLKVGGSQIG